jgi:hypothetical protein
VKLLQIGFLSVVALGPLPAFGQQNKSSSYCDLSSVPAGVQTRLDREFRTWKILDPVETWASPLWSDGSPSSRHGVLGSPSVGLTKPGPRELLSCSFRRTKGNGAIDS